MKTILLLMLTILLLAPCSNANDKNDSDGREKLFEKRYDDLMSQVYDIKYDLRSQIRNQDQIILEQRNKIEELQLKIKDLENNLFQTTQSLRNLEQEVWYVKKK